MFSRTKMQVFTFIIFVSFWKSNPNKWHWYAIRRIKSEMKKISWSYWKMKLLADKNTPITSFHIISKKHELFFVHCDSAFSKTRKEWSWDILYKYSHFLRNYLTKSNGVFCKMQAIDYSSITWKYTLIYSRLWKLLMRKVRLYFFWD